MTAFALIGAMGMASAFGAPLRSCKIDVHEPFQFGSITSPTPIPPTNKQSNADADYCALTEAGTGGSDKGSHCYLTKEKDGWTVHSGPGAGYADCSVTCFKLACR
jgi:hypothetical protein